MIKTQKIIKYCAIAFAIFLTFSIISSIMFGIMSIGNVFDNNDSNITDNLETLKVSNNIQELDINVKSINIIIKESSNFKIETNNKYIKLKEKNDKLSITEEKHNLFNNTDSSLIIYLPSDYLFNEVSIENGAGKIEIDKLSTKKIDLDLGAGKVEIQNINVTNETEIDGGAGEIVIENGTITNLDLDMGVGNLTLNASLIGNNEIDAGIGEINLNLNETLDNYKIKINECLGNATLNEEKMKNDIYYGTGSNIINIAGGIGNIKIKYSR